MRALRRAGWAACVVALAGCQELTATKALDVSFHPDTGVSAMPKELYDGELKHVVMKVQATSDAQALYTTRVVWTSTPDSVIRIDDGANCGLARETTPIPEVHACLYARAPGIANIKVRLEQPGLSAAETTFTVRVNQRWLDVAASTASTCAVNVKYRVFCWGAWELTGTGKPIDALVPRPLLNTIGLPFDRVFAGGTTACANVQDSSVSYCWGLNDYGIAGLGRSVAFAPVPTLPLNNSFTSVAPGYFFSCGITGGGSASCWGLNGGFSMGHQPVESSESCRDSPTEQCVYSAGLEAAARQVFAVSVASFHACAAGSTGVFCWGSNLEGQIGNGLIGGSSPVAQVPGLVPVAGDTASVAVGGSHSCAAVGPRRADKATWCWGRNADGETGVAGCPVVTDLGCDAPLPRRLSRDFASIVAGYAHTCGLTAAGAAYCWGSNSYGQLGRGIADSSNVTPAVVPLDSNRTFVKIASGDTHVCGITSRTGAMYCWGANLYGNLGDGTKVARSSARRVSEPVTGFLTFTP
ncbi:MAG: hypothetical protein ABIY52_16085 [Gemmatimonadaceae bacterium]